MRTSSLSCSTLFLLNLRVAPNAIPDKASRPNFPHVQAIEYAEHVYQYGHAAKHRKNAAEQKKQQKGKKKKKKKTKKKKLALSGMALGDIER